MKDHPEDGQEMSGSQRPVVMAKPADRKPSSASLIPLQMGSGRIPDGGQGANNNIKMKSIFDGPGGHPTVKLAGAGGNGHGTPPPDAPVAPPRGDVRPIIIAKLGQPKDQAPPAPVTPPPPVQPPTNVPQVLIREGGPKGLTKAEASDINAVLVTSINSAATAVGAGQTCVGVDNSTISKARDIQNGLSKFASSGSDTDRLSLDSDEVDVMDRVIQCADVYEKAQAASKGQVIAFVAGGLIIGTIVLVTMS